jgi:hypothetical protein
LHDAQNTFLKDNNKVLVKEYVILFSYVIAMHVLARFIILVLVCTSAIVKGWLVS